MGKVGKIGHIGGAHHGRYMHHSFQPKEYIQPLNLEPLSIFEAGLPLPFLIRRRNQITTEQKLEVKSCNDIMFQYLLIKNKTCKLTRSERDHIVATVEDFNKSKHSMQFYDGEIDNKTILSHLPYKHAFRISIDSFKKDRGKLDYIISRYKPALIVAKPDCLTLIYT